MHLHSVPADRPRTGPVPRPPGLPPWPHAGRSGWCRRYGHRGALPLRPDLRPIAQHPVDLATVRVPRSCHRHPQGSTARPHGDGTPWAWVPHAVLRPHRDPTGRTGPYRKAERRRLALRTRHLIDTGVLTPPATLPQPVRPPVQTLLTRCLTGSPAAPRRHTDRIRPRGPRHPGTLRPTHQTAPHRPQAHRQNLLKPVLPPAMAVRRTAGRMGRSPDNVVQLAAHRAAARYVADAAGRSGPVVRQKLTRAPYGRLRAAGGRDLARTPGAGPC
ncbi:DUF6083 domain-containing protein [Streptomyces sp. NPDC059785]|uniref:DUF6083 domain-containing protein n=1 Tax=Streptomyces sp. NPDC059785 TaxID=3346945 RepID=UPI00365781BF